MVVVVVVVLPLDKSFSQSILRNIQYFDKCWLILELVWISKTCRLSFLPYQRAYLSLSTLTMTLTFSTYSDFSHHICHSRDYEQGPLSSELIIL